MLMNQDTEWHDIMALVVEKSLDIIKNVEHQPENITKLVDQWLDFCNKSASLTHVLSTNMPEVQRMQRAYWEDAIGLWQDQFNSCLEGNVVPIHDRRFSTEEWVNNPFFNMLSQQYLLASEHVNSLLEHLDYGDDLSAKRLKFFARQYLEALSPDNFLHTNPHLIAETLQSHGKNLLLGLKNLLTDIQTGSPRLIIKMTDTDAFKVGENIAVTPGKVIYKNNMIELIQYTPQTAKVKSVPLLIVPPWINKYYILDLSVNNSFVRWLVEQGITVFIISWINPNKNYADKGIADYLKEGPLEAVNVIKSQLGIKEVNTLGFCIGGTLLSMMLAYNKARQDHSVRSATFLATMIDFSDPGDIAVFIDEKQIIKLEKHMKEQGYLEGHFMADAFNSLRASDLVWAFFIRNYLHGKPALPFDLLFWNMDTTNMPAKMHSEYLRKMYLDNDLIKPGKIHIDKIPLDISQIDIPVFFVSTKKDHIAPWKTTYRGFQAMSGKKQFLLGGSGHIAGIIIPPGGEKYGYYVNTDSPENPDDWLENAHYNAGSWWPEWIKWLKSKSGRTINAPLLADLPMQSLMEAPGSYVLSGVNNKL